MNYDSWEKLLLIVTSVLGSLASVVTIAEKIKDFSFSGKKKKSKRKNRKKKK